MKDLQAMLTIANSLGDALIITGWADGEQGWWWGKRWVVWNVPNHLYL